MKLCTNGQHYAELRCMDCGAHNGWVPKPEHEKPKRELGTTNLATLYSKGYCELCLIKEARIPKGESMEGHHVLEHERHHGNDERENIWVVCTACHKLIHWKRTYDKHKQPTAYLSEGDEDSRGTDEAAPVDMLEDELPF